MIRFTLLICLGLHGFLGFTQNLDEFRILNASGQVPEDFLTLSSEKYAKDLETNENEALDDNFFISTRFGVDEILQSGKVLFNDPLSTYVNQVAKYALSPEEGLFEKLRFYILKSNMVNAFSTDQGIIFITTGLLAQLESEAQLAFIICHETSHYTQHHIQDSYVERGQIIKGKKEYRGLSYSKRIEELSSYSKETELDADGKGIDLYLQSEYAVDEIIEAFGVLLYSYLPFADIEFDENFFNTKVLTVPVSFFPDTIKEITKEEDYNDKGSSHPNIKKRIDNAIDLIDYRESKGQLLFKVSEDDFKRVRDLARFENINLKLASRDYTNAIYDIYILQKEFQDNYYLEVSLMKALYGLSKYKNHRRYSEVRKKLRKIEGESYRLHAFINDLSKGQMNVLAYRNAYDLLQKYPDNDLLIRYKNDLKYELANNEDISLNKFSSLSFLSSKDSLINLTESFDIEDSIQRIDDSDLSKYKKIKLKKELRSLLNSDGDSYLDEDFHYYGLADLMIDDEFIKELKEIKDEDVSENERILLNSKDTYYLGIDSLVIVDPFAAVSGGNGKEKLPQSENKKIELSQIYETEFQNLDLEVSVLDSKSISQLDIDKYNNLGLINLWFQEIMSHDDLDMISSTHDQMTMISSTYGTSNFLFSGIDIFKAKKQFTNAHLLGLLSVYFIPVVVADLVVSKNYINYTVILIDADNDQIRYRENIEMNNKGNYKNMTFLIYHVLYNINSKSI